MSENSSTVYTATAVFSDASSKVVEPDWSSTCAATVAEIDATGLLTTKDVASDEACQVSASYTEEGITQNQALDITITAVLVPVVLERIEIEGPLRISEQDSTGAEYTCRAFFSDGSDRLVDPAWSVDCPGIAAISAVGLLTTSAVGSDTACQISAVYTDPEDPANTANDLYDVTVIKEVVIDNGEAGSSFTGTWDVFGDTTTSFPMGVSGANSLYSTQADDTYSFEIPADGPYEISLWWPVEGDGTLNTRCSIVPVSIFNGTSLRDTVYVNHTQDGGGWNVLGTYVFSGTARVVITSLGNCTAPAIPNDSKTFADAARFRFISDEPFVNVVTPANFHLQTASALAVQADADNLQIGWGVEFVLDEGTAGEQRTTDTSAPYTALFSGLSQSEHTLDAQVVDGSGLPVAGTYTLDRKVQIGVGTYYVAIGDSITEGVGDTATPDDDTSLDGRNFGGGFEPGLNDRLTADTGIPHTVVNEGVGGTTSADGRAFIPNVLEKHPNAQKFLVMFGTNDARPPTPVDSLVFRDNMQQIITAIKAAGKEVILAKAPITLGDFVNSTPYPDPDLGTRSVAVQGYNQVVDDLRVANGITVVAPDFYNLFNEDVPGGKRYDFEYADADNLHPNGLGYSSMADLWFQILTP